MRPPVIDQLLSSREESDRKQCIALLNEHLKVNSKDAKSWYDLACCHDFLGQEVEAEPAYRAALSSGLETLSVGDQKGFYVGFGSTLRNNKNFGESLAILRAGVGKFPAYIALRFFLGLTLQSMGHYEEACKVLLTMSAVLPSSVLDGYEQAIRYYAQQLDE